MKKILVIGSGGSGKSEFSRKLGEHLNIEVFHLDSLYWKPGWGKTEADEWEAALSSVMNRDSWIMDGNYSGTLEMRLAACDSVIFLDLPRGTCLWRVIKRSIKYRGKSRPDMAEGCNERFSFEFLFWVWNYRKRSRLKVMKLLNSYRQDLDIVHLTSTREVDEFFAR